MPTLHLTPAAPGPTADGTPYSAEYGDVYHSASGGLEQARHVFLGGNELPAAWAGRNRFVIIETGFGLGLNFLATWQAWRADPARSRQLHFISLEKHPLSPTALGRWLERYPELAELARQLVAAWPQPLPGLHRLHFENGALHLTLVFGDARDWLPSMSLHADAFYLDGFAPNKNPELWNDAIATALARLAAPGATLATWSVAEDVMTHWHDAGFTLEKRPGFANKRHMLVGCWPGRRPVELGLDRRALVIGAGAAGSAVAHRLAGHGYRVEVFEAGPEPGCGASGNLAGVFRPLPSLDDGRLSQLLRAGFLYGQRHLAGLAGVRYQLTGVLQVARDDKHQATQQAITDSQRAPAEFCRFVDRAEAAELAGWPVAQGGWWFAGAGWINPPSLCAANLAGIEVRYRCPVHRIERDDGRWRLYDEAGRLLGQAPILVLANGTDTPRLAPGVPIRSGRGLVTHVPATAAQPFKIVATRSGYVTPAVDGIHCAGATLDPEDPDPSPRLSDHRENLARLDSILPGYGHDLDPERLDGRVGFRPMSPDRLPLVGALAASDGLYLSNGFGSRGLVFAALCGELLAAQIDAGPLPVPSELARSLDPLRFLRRQRRAKV